MRQSTLFRWSLLSASIVLLLPNFLAQAGSIGIDLSWLKDVPQDMVVLVIVYLVFRQINGQKITIPTPEGQPDKKVSANEYLGKTMGEVLAFMRDSKATDKQLIHDGNIRTDLLIQTLKQFQDELVTGRGNQLTAIMDVRDEFHASVAHMTTSRNEIDQRLGLVASGIGDLQLGKADMKQALDELLKETRALKLALQPVLDRLGNIETSVHDTSQAAQDVKADVEKINQLMQTFDTRLNALSAVAAKMEAVQTPEPAAVAPSVPEGKEA